MSNDNLHTSITGPIALNDKAKFTKPPVSAAGIEGIKAAIQHANKEMGLAKSFNTLRQLNQKDGFDCPGCAWPDPENRSKLGEFCENGVKAVAEEATNARVDSKFFERYSIEELSQWSDYEIGKSGRLTEPFLLEKGESHYKPVSWSEAFRLIGNELNDLPDPNDAIFYTSGRSSNEAAFLYGLFIRAFGTNNMPDCSNMCHESSGAALGETLGIGKGSVILDDLYKADLVIVTGQNPGTNHPRMLTALEKCKENGGKILSINPLKEVGLTTFKNPQRVRGLVGNGTSLTDLHLQIKINQDVALMKLLMKDLLALEDNGEEVLDHDFIQEKTAGFEELKRDLAAQSREELLSRTGLDDRVIAKAVKLLAEAKKIIICWAMGLTQHKNGVDNIKECVNLLLAKGSIGKSGAGTCPVRGHSNVQGDRTVGIMHNVSVKLNQSIKKEFGFDPPEKPGLDTVHAIQTMHSEPGKVFIALGGNFLSAASDTAFTAKALQNCRLTVNISTKLNRTHLVTGDRSLILPTLGRTEFDSSSANSKFVTVENSMGKVHRSHGKNKPASKYLKSEPEIIAQIASSTLGEKVPVNWLTLGTDYPLLRKKISAIFTGFKEYEKRSEKGGFYLPNNAREGDFSKLPGGKAKFSVSTLPDNKLKKGELMLMTIRSHDQYNTTIYGLNDRYRGIYNERRVLLMNSKDLDYLGISNLEVVDIVSYYGYERKAENFRVISYDIPPGNAATYFPEANMVVPITEFAAKSHTPISKSIKIRVVKK